MERTIFAFVVVLGLLSASTAFTYTIESMQCSAVATEMGVPYKYGLFTGCLVKVEGKYIPLTNYRVM